MTNYNKKIFFLSTNTSHHLLFLNFLKKKNIIFDKILYESESYKSKFPTKSWIEKEQSKYEKNKLKELNYSKIINAEYFTDFNSADFHSYLSKLKPDLGVVFGTKILKKKTIGYFPDGLINIHRGIIDKYRGLDSDLWSIYHKDNNIGTTIHFINEKIDLGDVIQTKKINYKNIDLFNVRYQTTMLAAKMIKECLCNYKKFNKIKSIKQKKLDVIILVCLKF